MKNLIKFLSLLCLLAIFSACEKENELSEDEELEITNNEATAPHRSCGQEAHMELLLADPEYKKQHEAKFTRLENSAFTRDANCNNPTILPIAVHFQGISNPDASCLQQLVQTQIDIINADFQGNNTDITNWDNNAASSFPGISNGDACLEFCLATQNHPSGYGLNNGDLAVTVNQTTGDFVGAWSGYINIYVRANTGYLGYSPLGGSGNGDGVVIDATAFGSGSGCGGVSPGAPYNLGRTLTHELGHYLLLDHMWGGGNGSCNQDDGVSDTPNSTQPYYGCPNVGASSCNSTDMHMSYMDYTNDACMYMLSQGQVTRVENYVASSLQNVANNAAAVCDGGGEPTPTCNDGIQNGNETGVDCGGSCAPCDIAPTCNDGIQNGDETGVDCGGSCAPCDIAPTCNDGIQNGDETGVDCGGSCAPCDIDMGCIAPNNITANVLSNTSADISWDAVPSATSYRVRYRIQGAGNNWTTKSTSNTNRLLNNLDPFTTYQYKVRSICSDGSKSPYSPNQTFTTEGDDTGNCNGLELQFRLRLDDYGSETKWHLKTDYGLLIDKGGPYSDNADGTVITADWCLADGCYRFKIRDAYGDGICCDYGAGFYEILDGNGNVLISSNGQFGNSETIDFCIYDGFISNDTDMARTPKLKNGNRGQAKKVKK